MHSKGTTVLRTMYILVYMYIPRYICTLSSKLLIKLHLISKNRKYYVNDVIFITGDHFWPLSNKTRYVNKQLHAKLFNFVHCTVFIKFTRGI